MALMCSGTRACSASSPGCVDQRMTATYVCRCESWQSNMSALKQLHSWRLVVPLKSCRHSLTRQSLHSSSCSSNWC